MEDWIKVTRKTDGLELIIPKIAYSEKDFELVEDTPPDLSESEAVEVVEVNAEDFEDEDEDFLDEDDEIAVDMKDEFEVEEVVAEEAYTPKQLKDLPYKKLKAIAKKFDPTIKGNVSRAKCREIILGSK